MNMNHGRFLVLFAACLFALFPSALRAETEHEAGQKITIPQLTAAPPVDGSLGGSWTEAATFHLTNEATYRRPATEDTTVHIGVYHRTVYVAFIAQQREPLIATQVADGTGVLTGDAVMVHLWPNGLNGYAYWFATNMHGARDEYSSENSAYAPVWTAFGARTADGYVAVLKIPLSVMHVQKGGEWRAQFHRIVAASNSNYVWELDPEQASFIDGRYGGQVLGLDDPAKTTVHPRVQVYTLGALASNSAGGSTSRAGLDFSLPVTGTTSLFGALHPDYSDVEIDQQTIAPTEFARRFTEIRPFFTQASANFDQAQDLNAPMSTLYTPAIPTFRDGFGASGRQGTVSFGVFNASGYERDDNAYAVNVSDADQRVTFSDQEVQMDDALTGFHDAVDEQGLSYLNPHSHLTFFANAAGETGTAVTSGSDAQYQDVGGMYMTATTMIGAALQKMGSQFDPADGYANQPPGEPGIAGYTGDWSRQLNFSPQARILDVSLAVSADRFHSSDNGVNQSDLVTQARVDFKDLLSVIATQDISSLQTCAPVTPSTCNQSFLPYNGTGISLGYALNTSHPSTLSYTSGAYYHGTLTSWQRILAIPLEKRAALVLEADDTIYDSAVAAEPDSKQWLERASINYQFNSAISFDVGARKIVGTNQPYAFAPFGPASAFTASACDESYNVFYSPTSGCLTRENATNLSAALHFFRGNNELYLVYGDPSQLLTQPALYVKLIRYIGAGKGS